ncbi:DUF1844 domain-containing protein [Rhodopirellula sallentina]|uniref:Protein containing DUF1844 n=1 Tax=Rhodopirellula sallentina SM41 TaxID=1263870 RepID=M5UQB9_9BACT|nr:DUF1844 domain-containing protein [Rhodopirellula sallentina]EMI58178.1 protein containing DUF1844 [Rhodopirellula sallentina SM41]
MTQPNEENETTQQSPKIIVDSDWKEQVAKEKEAAAQGTTADGDAPESGSSAASETVGTEATGTESTASATPETADAADSAPSPNASGDSGPPLPAPSFEVLVSMLFTQAMSALGQMPSPVDGETKVDKRMAKHSIDMLEMLTSKTEGNLTENESKMLGEALHALRMTYVSVRD